MTNIEMQEKANKLMKISIRKDGGINWIFENYEKEKEFLELAFFVQWCFDAETIKIHEKERKNKGFSKSDYMNYLYLDCGFRRRQRNGKVIWETV